jgi:3-hydroxyisobutyrate dehydrogenase
MNIGYIGLGNMGGALAARFLASYPLRVFDIDRNAVARLEALGAIAVASPAEMAEQCDVIFLCLPKSEHVRSVVFGTNGLASVEKTGLLIVDQTTGNPTDTRQMARDLASQGLALIDAPVSGGPKGAKAGTIALMVGATTEQFCSIRPILTAISPNIFHAGEVGAGQVIKLANNLLHHSQRLLSLEIIALAVKNGIEPATAVDIILAGSGRNYFIEHNMHPRILAGEMMSGFTLELLHKDVRLATEMGMNSGVPMPFGNLVRELYQMHLNELGGEAQVNMVARVVDRISKTQVVPQAR